MLVGAKCGSPQDVKNGEVRMSLPSILMSEYRSILLVAQNAGKFLELKIEGT
jgi:hypothetical protein